jgi:hypothetical protein
MKVHLLLNGEYVRTADVSGTMSETLKRFQYVCRATGKPCMFTVINEQDNMALSQACFYLSESEPFWGLLFKHEYSKPTSKGVPSYEDLLSRVLAVQN